MDIIHKYKESCIAIGASIFTAFVYYNTKFIEDKGMTGKLYSATIPRWICYGMWALSLLLLIMDVRKQSKIKENLEKPEKKQINYQTFFLTIVAISVYILIMRPLGFCPASAIFLFAQTCILSEKKERKYLLFAAISVITSIAVYYIFRYGLSLMLPRGIMPF